MGTWRTRWIGFEVGLEKLPGGVRVADGGLLVDSEDEREVERVGAVGEGLFELTVDTEPFECGGEVAGGPGGPELAGRAEFDGGLLGDQQVGVGRVRPAVAAVIEPVQDRSVGEVVERADVAADGDAPVAQVDVVQLHGADRLRPCRVDGGQGDDEPSVWCGGGGNGLVDVRLDEGLEDAAGLSGDTDADRRVAEDLAVLLRVPEE
ncbi:hypothetical protein ACH4U5_31250 [Streptomyces sp. NPDC020858]|uniref:hypothetical protein n=1 Tax=Streptomyces sp. NPDC020858 TaxID=3365097 RepID=UPI0037B0EC21